MTISSTAMFWLLALLALLSCVFSHGSRISIPFNYNWRFALEDPAAPGAACCFSHDISNQSCTGDSLHQDTNHWTPQDCKLSCCADPDCFVWRYYAKDMNNGPGQSNWAQGSCQHGGADVKCNSSSADKPWTGGQRTSLQPLKRDWPFRAVGFNDASWLPVDLPHDFVINGSFAPDDDAHRAFLPRGVGLYRKHFSVPSSWENHTVQLVFDAALQYTEVYLNGMHVIDHRGGYTRFTARLDNCSGLKYGDTENVLALRIDARWGSGHWYEGGGLTRLVHIERLPLAHFVTDGVFVSPDLGARGHIFTTAELQVLTANHVFEEVPVRVSFVLRTWNGVLVAQNVSAVVDAMGNPVVSCTLLPGEGAVGAIEPWSTFSFSGTNNATVHSPNGLYVMTVSIIEGQRGEQGIVTGGGRVLDTINVTSGFRSVVWTDKLHLNGVPVQLRGFSHHDNFAGVGVAMPPRIFLFHAQAHRALGGNFWRMSHNPYDDDVYSILDALGVLAWDEARDFYVTRAAEFRSLLKQHRSHPCVAIFGLCNEAECYPTQNANPDGPNATVVTFKALVRELAPGRPVAMNDNGFQDGVDYDVAGWSHCGVDPMKEFHDKFPTVPQISSECCSCPSTSGYLPGLACMQGQNAPGLLPYVTGSIGVWTLNDYYGEQAKWPSTVAGYGQIDLPGFPKPAAFWYPENWLRRPNATLSKDADYNVGAVQLHTDLERSMATAQRLRGAYQNLTLTVDVPSAATCTGDRVVLDGRDVALLRIALVDSEGRPTGAGGPVNISVSVVSGPGRVLGVGNSDLSTHQCPQGNIIETVQGLARAVVQVSIDCTSPQHALSNGIDLEATGRTKVLSTCPSPLPDIVVQAVATSPTRIPLSPSMVRVGVSGDVQQDSALAVARRSEPCAFQYLDSFSLLADEPLHDEDPIVV